MQFKNNLSCICSFLSMSIIFTLCTLNSTLVNYYYNVKYTTYIVYFSIIIWYTFQLLFTGLDTVVGECFPRTPLQRCVTHGKRNIYAKVRHGDKAAIAADLRDIFRTGQRDYTVEMAWNKWQDMCNRWGKDYRSI